MLWVHLGYFSAYSTIKITGIQYEKQKSNNLRCLLNWRCYDRARTQEGDANLGKRRFPSNGDKHEGGPFQRVGNRGILATAPARWTRGPLLVPGASLLSLRAPLTFPDERGFSSKRKVGSAEPRGCALAWRSSFPPWGPFSWKLQTHGGVSLWKRKK